MYNFRYFNYVNSKESQQEDLAMCRKYNNEGDEESFIILKNKYSALIEAAIKDVASRFVGDVNCYIEHDDLVQEANIALLKCITRCGVYKNIENFPFILYTHVYNACNNYFADILSIDFITCDRGVNICEVYEDPYVYIETHEISDAILDTIKAVSPTVKDMLMYRFGFNNGDCLSLEEVADLYNMSYNSVRALVNKTYRKIRHDKNIRRMFFEYTGRQYF